MEKDSERRRRRMNPGHAIKPSLKVTVGSGCVTATWLRKRGNCLLSACSEVQFGQFLNALLQRLETPSDWWDHTGF